MSKTKKVTALVLAASRLGPEDVVAKSQNVSHAVVLAKPSS